MKKLFIVILLFTVFKIQAQNRHQVSIMAGYSQVDLLLPGLNVEASYTYNLFNRFSIGLQQGYNYQNDFPEFAVASANLRFLDGYIVSPRIDNHVMDLNAAEALALDWESTSIFYVSPILTYDIIRLFGFDISAYVGYVFQRTSFQTFRLKSFEVSNGLVSNFDPLYQVGFSNNHGLNVGVSLNRPISNSLIVTIDAKYHELQIDDTPVSSVFGALRVGLRKRF